MDYSDCLRKFDDRCARAGEEQEKLLLKILAGEKDTVWGKKYDFAGIRSVEAYQRKVPFSVFEDYEPLIERQLAGEAGLVNAKEPFMYCISSGSTGDEKYIPVSPEDARKQQAYWEGVIPGTIAQALSGYRTEELFGDLFQDADVYETFGANGKRTGVRSGVGPRYAKLSGSFPFSDYYAPPEVLFPEKLEEMLYVKLRFALADRNITALHSNFIHKLVSLFSYIERHLTEFAEDVATGQVSSFFSVTEEWQAYLKAHLAPDPARGEELKALADAGKKEGLIRRIWPNLKYARTISGELFRPYLEQYRVYAGDLPLHSFVYASSETNLGIADCLDGKGEYCLLPDVCFYEFLPESESEPGMMGDTEPAGKAEPTGGTEPARERGTTALTVKDVKVGGRYELIVTTLNGFYRYRLGDVVEVVGFRGACPKIRVCYRENLVLSVADEKLNVSQLEMAMTGFLEACGAHANGYCVTGDYTGDAPRYRVFVEADKALSADAAVILDRFLREMSFGYRSSRSLQEIDLPVICPLRSGCFRSLEKESVREGRRPEQLKPLRVLRSKKEEEFLERWIEQ